MKRGIKKGGWLLCGCVAAVLVGFAVLLALLPGQSEQTPTEYEVYWNVDRKQYEHMSEAGMSSRKRDADGYFHVRFFKDGEMLDTKVADRNTVNSIDGRYLMGLQFDESGIVTDIVYIEELPCRKIAWTYYIKSVGGGMIKCNSSLDMEGKEVLLNVDETVQIYDMTGMSGPVGTLLDASDLAAKDRVYALQDSQGTLTHIFVYHRGQYMTSVEGYCQHCQSQVVWQQWTDEQELPIDSGHYQLQNDIQMKVQASMNEEAKICLDLNGKTVTSGKAKRVYALFSPFTKLAIMDNSSEQTGRIKAVGEGGDQGLCVWVRYGQFYLYSGILDASEAMSYISGTTVAMEKETFFAMYGGEIIGGSCRYRYYTQGERYIDGAAGALLVGERSVVEMHDGLIRDGKTIPITYEKNGKQVTERGLAGNILLMTGATFTMNGGEIRNGQAYANGGNLCLDGTSSFTMNGGKITGGQLSGPENNGGSIWIGMKAKMTMNGGEITGGSCYNCGGNIYMNGSLIVNGGVIRDGKILDRNTNLAIEKNESNIFNVNGSLTVTGGQIYGGVTCLDTKADDDMVCSVELSGTANISKNKKGEKNLTLYSGGGGVKVTVGKLRTGAKIGINTNGIFTEKTSEANQKYFFSEVDGTQICYSDGRLAVGKMGCICASGTDTHVGACDGKQYFWEPWTSEKGMPNRDGYYYLTKDVTMAGAAHVTTEGKDTHVHLDLNGKTVLSPTDAGGRVYSLFELRNEEKADKTGEACLLTITDSSREKTGQVILRQKDSPAHQGSLIWGRYGDSVINIYGGTFNGEKLFTDQWGGLIASAGTVNIYDGTLIGGTVDGTNNTTNRTPFGGAIAMERSGATLNMYGGEIKNGYANKGGNVYIAKGAKMNLYDGTISGGNTVSNGGNIYLHGEAELNIHGGTIKDGRTGDSGGNIFGYENATVNMFGGLVTGGMKLAEGKEIASEAGNIFINDATLKLYGGTVDGDIANVRNSAIYIEGAPIVNAGKSGGITLWSDAPIQLGKLSGEKSSICVSTATGRVFAVGAVAEQADIFCSNLDYEALEENGQLQMIPKGSRFGCICGGKLEESEYHTHEQVRWIPWESTTRLPSTTGYYYLVNDVQTVGATITQAATIGLDLNGKTITGPEGNGRVYSLFGEDQDIHLILTDSVGTGRIQLSPATDTDEGQLVWVRKNTHRVDFYGGTYDGTDHVSKGVGAMVQAYAGQINVYGGTFQNGQSANMGGIFCVYGEDAQMNIYGGLICNGSSVGNGGNICARSKAELNIYGGEIRNGRTADSGGNIFVYDNATMNLYGGLITGGMKLKDGGEIAAESGNMFINNATVNLYGGTIDGDIADILKSTITVQGDPVIHKGQKAGITFWSPNGQLTCMELTGEKGSICVSTGLGRVFAQGVASDKTEVFCSDQGHTPILFGEGLQMAKAGSRVGCICGGKLEESAYHTHENVIWEPWTATDTLPVTTGNYYLTGAVVTAGNTVLQDAVIALDLNGQVVTGPATNGRVYSLFGENKNIHLILTDSVGTGVVQLSPAENTDEGQLVWVRKNTHRVDFYGGIYDGTGHVSKNNGAMVQAYAGQINVYGGTFQNGQTTNMGGIFCVYGETAEMNMYGGLIQNGYSKGNGGNICARTKAKLNIYGGEIRNGRTADSGGNIFLYENAVLNLYDGWITGGMKLKDGVESAIEAGNIFINNATMNLYGGIIDGDIADVIKSTITVKGAPVINKGQKAGLTFWSSNGKLSCEELTGKTASICISAGKGRIFATGVSQELKDIFVSDRGYQVKYTDAGLEME